MGLYDEDDEDDLASSSDEELNDDAAYHARRTLLRLRLVRWEREFREAHKRSSTYEDKKLDRTYQQLKSELRQIELERRTAPDPPVDDDGYGSVFSSRSGSSRTSFSRGSVPPSSRGGSSRGSPDTARRRRSLAEAERASKLEGSDNQMANKILVAIRRHVTTNPAPTPTSNPNPKPKPNPNPNPTPNP